MEFETPRPRSYESDDGSPATTNLFNAYTLTNYQRGATVPYQPGFNPNKPSSVQENDCTFCPRTLGINVTYHTQWAGEWVRAPAAWIRMSTFLATQ